MYRIRMIIMWTLLTGVLITNCKEEKTDEHVEEEIPRIIVEQFSLIETKQGEKLWVLDADIARVYSELIRVERVKITFFNKEQVEFSVLHAPGGLLNTKTHNVLVGDSVAVYTNDSTKLYTDSLFWQNDSERIITHCPVRIIKKDSTIIEGTGLRADPYLEKIEILGTAKGISPIELPDINK